MTFSNRVMGCTLILILFSISCTSLKLKEFVFPDPIDTSDKEIHMLDRTSYRYDGVYVDNEFDGGRMNGFVQMNDTTFRVIVAPENFPINKSAYYAFRIKSEKEREIDLEIKYTKHEHRYVPKLSYDGVNWVTMDTTQFDTIKGADLLTMRIKVDRRKLYICGQELMTSSHNKEWIDNLSKGRSYIKTGVAGQSKLGRNIYYMDICDEDCSDKDAIVVFSRLHPPEITGYMAMKSFVETIVDTSHLSKAFRKNHRILVYPMINPDGVDLGHWRHSAGGIDLNRDWAYYRQEEVNVTANHLVDQIKSGKNRVVVGLDFHSTQKDVYYTLSSNRQSHVYGFKDIWLESIDDYFDDYAPEDSPSDYNSPITKTWFFRQFGAEGITYEVGDETPRPFVKDKARVAAREMMKLLVLD